MKAPMTLDQRRTQADRFLTDIEWADADIVPLAADASTRRYFRLRRQDQAALLMDAPEAAEGVLCPPDADEEGRRALGYNAMARIAGNSLSAFVSVANWLNDSGVRAPKVLASDLDQGFALIEDFGGSHLKDVAPADEAPAYRRALDVLGAVRKRTVASGPIGSWELLSYDRLALQTEADLFLDWYIPHYAQPLTEDAKSAWYHAWAEVLKLLSPADTLVLRDFHAENILIPDDGPLAVIDFQDALVGQPAYDAVSLLEDARRDVDLGLAAELLSEDTKSIADPTQYLSDYAVLALQRNMKILGIFARLIHRDGKLKYDAFFPRVRGHVARDFDRPAVAPVRAWAEKYAPALLSDGGGAA